MLAAIIHDKEPIIKGIENVGIVYTNLTLFDAIMKLTTSKRVDIEVRNNRIYIQDNPYTGDLPIYHPEAIEGREPNWKLQQEPLTPILNTSAETLRSICKLPNIDNPNSPVKAVLNRHNKMVEFHAFSKQDHTSYCYYSSDSSFYETYGDAYIPIGALSGLHKMVSKLNNEDRVIISVVSLNNTYYMVFNCKQEDIGVEWFYWIAAPANPVDPIPLLQEQEFEPAVVIMEQDINVISGHKLATMNWKGVEGTKVLLLSYTYLPDGVDYPITVSKRLNATPKMNMDITVTPLYNPYPEHPAITIKTNSTRAMFIIGDWHIWKTLSKE